MILHSINRQTKLFSYFFMRQSSIPAQFENLPLARTQLFQSLCNQFLNILFFQTLLYIIYIIYNPQIEMFARFKMKSSFHKTKRII